MKRFTTTAGLLLCSLLLSFTSPSIAVEAKVSAPHDFKDVSYTDWHAEYDDYMYLNGYMNGKSSGKFDPAAYITRAEFAQILYNIAGQPDIDYNNQFDDIPNGLWYTKACLWANETRIMTGTGTHRFAPTGLATREQAAAILFRYATRIKMNVSARASLSKFPDSRQVSVFAKEGMQWCVATDIIRGSMSTGTACLAPWNNISRAEVATMLCRLKVYSNVYPKPGMPYVHYHGAACSHLEIPHILQTYPLWHDKFYGAGPMAQNACGPTAMAMVESYLKKTFISPANIVDEIGMTYWNDGTTSAFFEKYPEAHGFQGIPISHSPQEIARWVNLGHPVICHMDRHSSFANSSGHYVVVSGITKYGGFLILDPVTEARCEIVFTADQIRNSTIEAWAY